MNRVAILVPGIMGSRLSSSGQEIWGENFYSNYRTILEDPMVLHWRGRAADAVGLIERVRISRHIPYTKYYLWRRTIKMLERHPEFGHSSILKFAYDWRAPLEESAAALRGLLDPLRYKSRFTLITHSMGGLLVRVALALGYVGPASMDRLIHVGTPLLGAAEAFRTAYTDGRLPFLREVNDVIRGRDADAFFALVLRTVRSFPSLHQLWPPSAIEYLFYDAYSRFNPLAEAIVAPEMKAHAIAAHLLLERARDEITNKNVDVFSVYSEKNTRTTTDEDYLVRQIGRPHPGYEILRTRAGVFGDGSVLAGSAASVPAERCRPLINVSHMTMCDDERVVATVHSLL